jgi:hypothetical protein
MGLKPIQEDKNTMTHQNILFDEFKNNKMQLLLASYVQREVEALGYQVKLAEKNISIGKELIEIEKMMKQNHFFYEFEICEWFTGIDGKQKIDPTDRNLCKRMAEFNDIEKYIWIGWDNLVYIINSIDLREKFSIENILKDIGIDQNDPSTSNIKKLMSKIDHYRVYKTIKKLNKNIQFKSISSFIESGVDFSNKELLNLIKKASIRPDTAIKNYINAKKKGSIQNATVKGNKRSLFDNIEPLMVRVTEALRIASAKGEYPKSLDSYIHIKFIQEIIDMDKSVGLNIIWNMVDDDDRVDELVNNLMKEYELR